MNLTKYLLKRLGEKIETKIQISSRGISGTVESVIWKRLKDEIDEENSWVSIKWNNGNYSDHTIETVGHIEVISEG